MPASLHTGNPKSSHSSIKKTAWLKWLAMLQLQVELRSEDRFFVLACDGVWDVMSNQEVVQFVSVCLDSGMSLDSIASQLLDACLAPDPRETRGIGAPPQHLQLRLRCTCLVLTCVLRAPFNIRAGICQAVLRCSHAAPWPRLG